MRFMYLYLYTDDFQLKNKLIKIYMYLSSKLV